jgi:hypothetical protein
MKHDYAVSSKSALSFHFIPAITTEPFTTVAATSTVTYPNETGKIKAHCS